VVSAITRRIGSRGWIGKPNYPGENVIRPVAMPKELFERVRVAPPSADDLRQDMTLRCSGYACAGSGEHLRYSARTPKPRSQRESLFPPDRNLRFHDGSYCGFGGFSVEFRIFDTHIRTAGARTGAITIARGQPGPNYSSPPENGLCKVFLV
jgi:hypothetical protein